MDDFEKLKKQILEKEKEINKLLSRTRNKKYNDYVERMEEARKNSKLYWMCRSCWHLLYPMAQFGLTSYGPQKCKKCGADNGICVLSDESSRKIEEICNDISLDT